MILYILVTCTHDNLLKLSGERCCWSLHSTASSLFYPWIRFTWLNALTPGGGGRGGGPVYSWKMQGEYSRRLLSAANVQKRLNLKVSLVCSEFANKTSSPRFLVSKVFSNVFGKPWYCSLFSRAKLSSTDLTLAVTGLLLDPRSPSTFRRAPCSLVRRTANWCFWSSIMLPVSAHRTVLSSS